MYIISGTTHTTGIVLSTPTFQNPATVAIGGYVTNTTTSHNGDAIYGTTAAAWTFTNYGTIKATGTNASGVDLRSGGLVINGASGAGTASIAGVLNSVEIVGTAGTVVNYGSLRGTGSFTGAGSGVYLGAGGTVSNKAGAVISDYHAGVSVRGSAGTVVNLGSISGTGGVGVGVYLHVGGYVGNSGLIQGGADGVLISGAAGTVSNYGTITATGTGSDGVKLAAGGSVTNGAFGGTAAIIGYANGVLVAGAAGTVSNFATIRGIGSTGNGVYLSAGGSLDNFGLVAGYDGVRIGGGVGTLFNNGTIQSTGTGFGAQGIDFLGGGTLTNYGTILGLNLHASGINAGFSGDVIINGASESPFALIEGNLNGIDQFSGAGTVLNFATIISTATNSQAVLLLTGGSVTNGATALTGALITGGADGVSIGNSAGQTGTVVNFATITGTGVSYASGIFFKYGGFVTNAASGLIEGVGSGIVEGFGTTSSATGTVINSGSIIGTGTNSAGLNLFSLAGASVTNALGGLIQGVQDGIGIGGPGTVGNSGMILASGTNGIGVVLNTGGTVNNSGSVIGGINGVVVNGSAGTVINSGSIGTTDTNNGAGVAFHNGGTVNNAVGGQISGYNNAVFVSGAASTVSNLGTLASTGTGSIAVDLTLGGSVTNGAVGSTTALIQGGGNGISIRGGIGTVANFGTVSSTSLSPVYLNNGGIVTNGAANSTTALIQGYAASPVGFGALPGTVVNFGTILQTGHGTAGQGINFHVGGVVTNASGGLISSYHSGVYATTGAATLVNYGTIQSTGSSFSAINLRAGGSVTNGSTAVPSALIRGASGGVFISGSAGTVSNAGTILATGSTSVIAVSFVNVGGAVTNSAGALISGTGEGVGFTGTAPAAGTVVNYGTILSIASLANAGTVFGGVGVVLNDGGAVTNGPAGLIEGYHVGVLVNAAPAMVSNFGTILAVQTAGNASAGVSLFAGGTLVNSGTVLATHLLANAGGSITGGIGVNLIIGGSVTNGTAGLIEGYHLGVQASVTAAATVVNFGTIVSLETAVNGYEGSGVNLQGGGLITNSGLIKAAQGSGVSIGGTAGGVGTVINSGTILSTGSLLSPQGFHQNPVQLLGGGLIINGAATLTSALIQGYERGIYAGGSAGHPFLGAYTTVVNYGTIAGAGTGTATTAANINLVAGGVVTNHGLISSAARSAISIGTTSFASVGTVTNFGTIAQSGVSAGSGVYLAGGGIVTNQSGGLISAYRTGISLKNLAGTVANYGSVASTGTYFTSVYLGAGGIVTNAAGGLITGNWTGVGMRNVRGTLLNLGTIASAASIKNAGSLSGDAVFDPAGGLIVNGAKASTTALITGYENGVSMGTDKGIPQPGAIATLINYATISSTSTNPTLAGFGARLGAGGTIANYGSIFSHYNNAVAAVGTVAVTVANFGLIENFTTLHSAVYIATGGIVTNAAGASIIGGRSAISFNDTAGTTVSFGTVINAGSIQSTGITAGSGVYFGQGGVLTQASGVISAYRNGLMVKGSAGTATNLGTILSTGTTFSGVYFGKGGSIGNSAATALIAGYATGVFVTGAAGTVANQGTIAGTGDAGRGIYLAAGGSVSNSGLVTALADDVVVFGAAGTVVNSGTMSSTGGGAGVWINAGGTVVNSGLITGGNNAIFANGAYGTVVNSGSIVDPGAGGDGVCLDAGGSVSNSAAGLIAGPSVGIEIGNAAGTVSNAGTAEGTGAGGVGVYLEAGGSVTNLAGGLISGLGNAIAIGQTTAAAATVTNSGTVTGGTGIAVGAADTGNNTIVNFGTIIGSGGTAISLGTTGNDLVVVESGSILSGAIANFHTGDLIDLAAVTWSSGNTLDFSAATLTVSGGGVSQTLTLAGIAATAIFILSSAGDGGTDVGLVSSGGAITVSSGQILTVLQGQSDSGIAVLGGGTVDVHSGGTESGSMIAGGGTENVAAGGLDIGATISSGGFEDLFGSASATVVLNGGSQTVEAGGVATAVVLDGTGLQTVFGSAGGTVVSAGDEQLVELGGVAGGTTISSGGSEVVLSGGSASNTTIAGGTLELSAGAVTGGGIDFVGSGGVLQVDGTTVPSTPISGFVPGDTIDLRGLSFSSGASATFNAATGMLQVTAGGVTDTLNLSGVAPSTAFLVASDGQGGTSVIGALAAATLWTNSSGGNWTVDANWSAGAPTSNTDATIGVPGGYTVTLSAGQSGQAKSLTINNPSATLLIRTSSGGAPTTLAVQSGLVNSGTLDVDVLGGDGGSTVTIGGTLVNTGTVTIGVGNLTASTTVTIVDGTNSGGTLVVQGNASSGTTNQATLDVTGATGTAVRGFFGVRGDADIELSTGLTAIASGGELTLEGSGARVSLGAGSTSTALTGLATNSGTLLLRGNGPLGAGGAALTTSVGLVNAGVLDVDIFGGDGGSSLTIGGVLTNTGSATIGVTNLSSPTSVTATDLANSGSLILQGNTASGTTGQATLDITGTAPATISGFVAVRGNADLAFGGGVTAIAGGGELTLEGAGARGSLSGLATNSGTLLLRGNGSFGAGGATLTTGVGLTNAGVLDVDIFNGDGASSLTLGGVLTNTGTVQIGGQISGFPFSGLSANTIVTASGLNNTGTLLLVGNTRNPSTNQATLDITGAAPGTVSGTLNVQGDADLEFAGGGITAIAVGANLGLFGAQARISLGADTASTALAGLASNAGGLFLGGTTSLGVSNPVGPVALTTSVGLVNTGLIDVDAGGLNGGALVTFGGVLTNSGSFNLGAGDLTGPSLVTVLGLVNTGAINLQGNASSGTTASATLLISGSGSDSGSGTIVVNAAAVLSAGGGLAGGLIVQNGGVLTIGFGGTATGVTAGSGGRENVLFAGTANAPVIAGGLLDLMSGSNPTGTISFAGAGGTLEIDSPTMPTNTIGGLGSGDVIDLRALAFSATNSATLSGNTLTVSGGGVTDTLSVTGVAAGTTVSVTSDGFGGTDVVFGSSGGGIVVGPGQTLTVSSGQVLSGVEVLSGGTLDVASGGTVVSAQISGGGVENVFAGGTDSGTTVSGGGFENVFGLASGTLVLNGGSQTVEAVGSALGTVLDGSGLQSVLGFAGGTVVSGGDEQLVEPGGVASGTRILAGGSDVVLLGGATSDTTIAGGRLELSAGATAGGVTGFAGVGGVLQIDGTTGPASPIGGFMPGDTIDLRALSGGSAGSVTLGSGNVLTVHESGGNFSLQLDPSQNFAGDTFAVADDGFGGTDVTVSAANLLINGGFEASTSNFTTPPGWTNIGHTDGVIAYSQFPAQPVYEGLEFYDLGGFGGAGPPVGDGIEQTVATTPGTAYTLTFGLSGENVSATETLQVAIGSQLTDFTLTVTGSGEFTRPFATEIIPYVATGSATTIAFTILSANPNTGSNDPLIDGVIFATMAVAPPAPTGLALSPASDSGVLGDDITNVTTPVITGMGVSGDTLTLFDGSAVVGSGTVGSNGSWAVTSRALADGAHNLTATETDNAGTVSAPSAGLTITIDTTPPPAPSGLALDPGSDSGVKGDNLTNATVPLIDGTGEAGDVVTLFADGVAVGSSTVGAGGLWSVSASVLSPGSHSLSASESDAAGNLSALSGGLLITIDTTAPLAAAASLTVAANANATPLGIAAPSDPDNPAALLTITVAALPGDGTVTLADGVTAVRLGEVLTANQLTGLEFAPGSGQAGTNGTFAYTVADPAGNSTTGNATVSVTANSATSLFDFVFVYNDGKDYDEGSVADNGTFGYRVGQTITTSSGQYTIFALQSAATSEPSGSVSVMFYSHGGPGQASPLPVATAAGRFDGTKGLGSESDQLLGTDGLAHPFSGTQEASFTANALFGFVYTYADGAAFYSGTVADDGSFGIAAGSKTITDAGGRLIGSYTIVADGVTSRAAGSVVVDRFTAGGSAFPPNQAGSVDGTQGLGSETATITAGGSQLAFSDTLEPVVPAAPGSGPVTTAPSGTDVITSEIDQLYAELLNRAPDPGGLAAYSALLANGASVAGVRVGIADSAEAQGDLNLLFRQIFDRDADPGGLATYTRLLEQGASIYTQRQGSVQGGSVQLILAQSAEAQTDLNQIYLDTLNRNADGGGLTAYEGLLGNSFDLDAIRGIIAHSPEAAGDLASLFQNALGRPPGAAELIGMADQLAAGGATQQSLGTALTTTGSAGGFTTLTAPTGNATLTAPAGTPTLLVFADIAFGNDTIAGFDPTQDTIQLSKALVADLPTLLKETASQSGGSLITLNSSQSIFLNNLAPAALGTANFRFT